MITKKDINIFYAVTFMYWAALYAHVSILSSYASDLGASATFIGVITGSYGFMQLILRLPLGILSDKLSKKKIFITLAFVSSFIAGTAMYLIPTPVGLLIGRIFCGISACAYVQLIVLFNSYFKDKDIPRAVGNINALGNFSKLLIMLLAGFIAAPFGKDATFLLTIGTATIGLVLSFFIYETKINRKPLSFRQISTIFSERNLIIAIVLAIICQFLAFGKSFAFVPLAAANMGASSIVQSYLTALYTFAAAIAALLGGRLASKYGLKQFLILGLALHALGSFVIPVIPTLGGLYISQFLSGAGTGIAFSLMMSMGIKGIASEKRGSAMGLYQALYAIGMVSGPVVVGALADSVSLNWGFSVTGILAVVGVIIAVVVVRKEPKVVA